MGDLMETDSDRSGSDFEVGKDLSYENLKKGVQTGKTVEGERSSSIDFMVSSELFVCPWMGIVANIPVQVKNGRFVGESGSKLRDELIRKGFNPMRVHPLWNYRGHSGFAIVEFQNKWLGLSDAIRFDKAYEANHQGKRDYFAKKNKGDKLYCWVARSDDFYAKNSVGDHLRRNGDLKTLEQCQEEENRKNSKLVSNLTQTIEDKDIRLWEMETKYRESAISLNNLIKQKDEMIRAFNEEREKMQQRARGQLEKIFQDHDRNTLELEQQRNELKMIEKELEKREAHNEKKILMLKQEQNERAMLEQKRVDVKVLKLAEDHKREQEELDMKMIELEKELNAKQALELEIQRLKGRSQVAKHMGDSEDGVFNESLNEIQEELQEKEEELEHLEDFNQALIVKERKTNDELQEARKELVSGWMGVSSKAAFDVKKMGELNCKPFLAAAKSKYSAKEANMEAVKICTLWETYIRDPHWHPFTTIRNDKGEGHKIVIDEEDKKLKKLREEHGDEAYQAVVTALMEMEEFNASGRYPISELWNTVEKRKATLKEGISHLMKQWRSLKRMRH